MPKLMDEIDLNHFSKEELYAAINQAHAAMVDSSKTFRERNLAAKHAKNLRAEIWRRRPLKKEDKKPIKILARYYREGRLPWAYTRKED